MDFVAHGKEQRSRWSQLIADVWDDTVLRKRLLADPKSVLKERGIDTQDGVELKVLENSPSCTYLTIPLAPGPSELSEDDLVQVAGGQAPPTPKPKKKTGDPKQDFCGWGPNASCSPTDPRGTNGW